MTSCKFQIVNLESSKYDRHKSGGVCCLWYQVVEVYGCTAVLIYCIL